MNLTKNALTLVATLLVALPFAARGEEGSDGPNQGRVVVRCLHTLGHVTGRHARKTAKVTRRSVFVINQLQQDGEDEAAATVAENAESAVGRIGEHAAARIQEVVDNCSAILQEIGADPQAFAMLEQGAARATEKLQEVAATSLQKIEDALATP